jgi:hypothetical protein
MLQPTPDILLGELICHDHPEITNHLNTYKYVQVWNSISTTTGSVTVPKLGGGAVSPTLYTIQMDQWPGLQDSIVVALDGKPKDESVYTAGGAIITSTLNSSGAYVLSGTPASTPVAIVFWVKLKTSDSDSIDPDYELERFDVQTFLSLSDVLTKTYSGKGNYVAVVNAGGTGIELTDNLAIESISLTALSDITPFIIKAYSGQTKDHPLAILKNSSNVEISSWHTDDVSNLFIGWSAGYWNSIGVGLNNTYIGYKSGSGGTIGTDCTAVGAYSMSYNSNNQGAYNNAFGAYALGRNTLGTDNNASGYGALERNTIGSYNTAMGMQCMKWCIGGTFNTGMGKSALFNLNNGDHNTGVGAGALIAVTDGIWNTGLGAGAGFDTTIGGNNVFVGGYTGQHNVTGSFNAMVGTNSGIGVVANSYSYTSTLGAYSLFNITTASYVLALGAYAGYYTTNQNNEIFINTLDRTNRAGDIANSPVYILQNATLSSQYIYLNGKVFLPQTTLASPTLAGCIEQDGTHLYVTFANAGTRYQLDQQATLPGGSSGDLQMNNGSGAFVYGGLNYVAAGAIMTYLKDQLWRPSADGTSALRFQNNGGTVDTLSLDTSNNRVGIGIQVPLAKIHLNNSTNPAVAVYAKWTNFATGALAGDGLDIGIDASANAVIKNYENTAMQFYTNNSQFWSVTGNTVTYTNNQVWKPSADGTTALDFKSNGDILVMRMDTTNRYIYFWSNTNSRYARFKDEGDRETLDFLVHMTIKCNNTDIIYCTNAGTTTIKPPFSVGDASKTIFTLGSPSYGAGGGLVNEELFLTTSAAPNLPGRYNGNALNIHTGYAIAGNGNGGSLIVNLGYGNGSGYNGYLKLTTSAAALLGTHVTNSVTGATNTDGTLYGIDATGNANIWQYENLPMIFATNNTERLRILAAGHTSHTAGLYEAMDASPTADTINDIRVWNNSGVFTIDLCTVANPVKWGGTWTTIFTTP